MCFILSLHNQAINAPSSLLFTHLKYFIMDLEITNCNNFFTIKGSLNRQNLDVFRNEFRHIFERANSLTISIEGITSMDRYGVNALAELHNESVAKNKSMSIIGLGCKDLYNHFKSEVAA